MYAEVLVEINSIDKTFTYKASNKTKIGMRVLVPFGNRCVEGFVLKIFDEKNFDYEVKDIIKLIDDKPVINEEMLKLGKYISKKSLSSLMSAYQTMLPRALKAKSGRNINKKYALYVKCLNDSGIKTDKQKKLYNYILDKGEVLKKSIDSKYILKSLINNGNLVEFKKEVYRLDEDIEIKKTDYTLTDEQSNVIKSVDMGRFKPYLLHGVTGSGKTLVYIKLIEKVLKVGKEAILLVPEISLTPQVVSIFKSHFGKVVAILHSGLSDGEKYDEWRKIENGDVSIVIGARSAIFAPFTNIGIIIIDEEHSSSYKQENIPRYSAIDVSLKRSMNYNCPLILGSATPSVESYTRCKLGVYELLEMKNRVNKNLPNVELVDMKEEFKNGNRVFSECALNKINDRLEKDEQVIILLNRRGYSTVISCHECGFTHKCPNCDIPLTYHKSLNVMKCHYCDYTSFKLLKCPKCGSNINSFGMGTEKLYEIIKDTFSKARVIRMDVDTTRRKGSHKRIIDDFKSCKYNILVGTQMIAKGLDFPNVTLVVVINGDASLNIPDFRSGQRTFELLSQVSGRAGRSDKLGDVIVQGFNMDHYSIVCAKNNDYDSFYEQEMNIRKVLKYPPYYNLCLVRVSGKDYDKVFKEASKIGNYLKNNLSDIVLGPASSNMPMINKIYYVQIIIKYKNTKNILDSLLYVNGRYKKGSIKVDIDLNPIKI